VIGTGNVGLASGACMAERLGLDTESVRQGIGSDPRICYSFLYLKAGYRGSCFPKNVKALIMTSTDNANVESKVLSALEAANDAQSHAPGTKVKSHFGSDMRLKDFALCGPPVTQKKLQAPVAFDRRNLYEPKFERSQSMGTFQLDAETTFGSGRAV
jgi:hypothetical protein